MKDVLALCHTHVALCLKPPMIDRNRYQQKTFHRINYKNSLHHDYSAVAMKVYYQLITTKSSSEIIRPSWEYHQNY